MGAVNVLGTAATRQRLMWLDRRGRRTRAHPPALERGVGPGSWSHEAGAAPRAGNAPIRPRRRSWTERGVRGSVFWYSIMLMHRARLLALFTAMLAVLAVSLPARVHYFCRMMDRVVDS